jgi:dTDP-4-dehydrorhamnose reductase
MQLINDGSEGIPSTVVFGATGFLGSHIYERLRNKNPHTLGVARQASGGFAFFDLAKPDIKHLRLKEQGITSAIIAAAITRIGICEKNPKTTRSINVDGTLELARQLHNEGIKVVIFSSDYVFDGITGHYDDFSPVNPLNEYGRQKTEVEMRLPVVCRQNCLIVRLSKVYSIVKGSGTLLDEMASKLVHGDVVRAARDQIFCPTDIDDVVQVMMLLLTSDVVGIINVCSPEAVSRANLAAMIADALRIDIGRIQDIYLRDLGEPFERPKDTSMISVRLSQCMQYDFKQLRTSILELCGRYREYVDGC